MAAATEAFVVEALRTPLRGLELALPPELLVGAALGGVVARSGVAAARLDAALLAGIEPSVALRAAGLPRRVPSSAVGSGQVAGLVALRHAILAVFSGVHDLVVAGGVSQLDLAAAHSAAVAQRVARRVELPAEAVGAWCDRSAERALTAREERAWLAETVDLVGDFDDAELMPGPPAPPAQAAAAVLLVSGAAASRWRLRTRARVVGVGSAVVDAGLAPRAVVPAARQALEVAGIAVDDLSLVELDEVWPAATAAVVAELGLDLDRVCVRGTTTSAGRPAGVAGLVRFAGLVHALDARSGRYGLCAAADDRGQAIAVVIDRQVYG